MLNVKLNTFCGYVNHIVIHSAMIFCSLQIPKDQHLVILAVLIIAPDLIVKFTLVILNFVFNEAVLVLDKEMETEINEVSVKRTHEGLETILKHVYIYTRDKITMVFRKVYLAILKYSVYFK